MADLVREAMGSVKVPDRHDRVFKDECVFSFDTPETPTGLYTSLTTWQSFGRDYVDTDFEKNGNRLYLKQVWKRVVTEEIPDAEMKEANATAPSKMAIGVEGGFDLDKKQYDKHVTNYVVVLPQHEHIRLPNDDLPTVVTMAVDAILAHDGFQRAAQVAAAWEEEDRKESKYAKDLPQLDNEKKISPDPRKWCCEESGMTENLWLNLSTGHIGSGRRNWDGSGGTGGAMTHFEETGRKYPLVVKLGTITPQGADVYSYAPDEDDLVLDPYLAQHLAHWGINMQQQTKTEKTLTELQIELNQSFQYSRITESGSELVAMHGPGYVGLDNLGNSCYMASVMQILFSMPEIEARFKDRALSLFKSSSGDPSEDLLVMMAKMGVGLLSDRYSKPIPMYETEGDSSDQLRPSAKVSEEYGSVKPFMFKTLIGKGHAEFGSGRQQDASEFFQYFLDKITRAEHAGRKRLLLEGETSDSFIPTSVLFGFELEERIEDTQSNKVKYMARSENLLSLAIDTDAAVNKEQYHEFQEQKKKRQKLGDEAEPEPVQLHVPLSACLHTYAEPEAIENFTSPETGQKGTALKRTRFKTFPEYLAVHLKRYYLAGNEIRKLDASVPMPDELDLGEFRGTGLVDGEVLLPEDTPMQDTQAPDTVVPDPAIVSQLMSMGFSENGSKRAAVATNNASAEASMEWVFAHMQDPDFNDPPAAKAATPAQHEQFSSESLSSLTAMGFTEMQAKAALKSTGGSLMRAADWLFSHTGDLDAAVREVEATSSVAESNDTSADAGGVSSLDGEPTYELLGFASHLGSNTSCGHYVAHIKKEGRFVLYNDAKVAISQNPPTDLGFLYIYRRKN